MGHLGPYKYYSRLVNEPKGSVQVILKVGQRARMAHISDTLRVNGPQKPIQVLLTYKFCLRRCNGPKGPIQTLLKGEQWAIRAHASATEGGSMCHKGPYQCYSR